MNPEDTDWGKRVDVDLRKLDDGLRDCLTTAAAGGPLCAVDLDLVGDTGQRQSAVETGRRLGALQCAGDKWRIDNCAHGQ